MSKSSKKVKPVNFPKKQIKAIPEIKDIERAIYLHITQSKVLLTSHEIKDYIESLGCRVERLHYTGKQVSFRVNHKGKIFVTPEDGLYTVDN